ncbi:MAG TPA: MFS transporter [Myxococcota bacterium]|nr:MFS transporter [Myxococcota bacterium]
MNDTTPAYQRAAKRSGALPLSTLIYQGIGAIPDACMLFAFGTLLLFYYNQVLGMPGTLASAALMLALVVDAIVDPLVGSLSDGLRSRLGRRHALMYGSIVPLGIASALAFLPPAGLSQNGLFAWLLGSAIAARIAMSFFGVPWNAMVAELSDDYVERSKVMMWRYLAAWFGGLAFVLVVWTFVFPSSPAFTPGHLNPRGYPLFAALLGATVALAALASTHLTRREVPYLLQPTNGAARFSWARFLRDLALAASNRDFALLVVAILVTAAIAGTATALDIYALTYFWDLDPERLRWFGFSVLGAVLAFAVIGPLQRRFEKRGLLITSALISLVSGFIVVGLRFADVLPANGDPRLLAILIANATLRIASDTIAGIMLASMIVDTLDVQELAVGQRQEGVFSAVLSFAGKAATGLGVGIGGPLLDHAVRMPAVTSGMQLDAATLTRLGLVAGFALPALYLIPISLAAFYRINRARHAEIRARLDLRNR